MEHGKRLVALFVLLLAALVFYGIGMHYSALAFILVGALLECGFWLKLFKGG
ncbi:hypothetical protein [Shewanella colwelliana]|nr:hypothetical protein [Shewanella colwelliana]MCZ4337191.1 hypothetical protein [Shewanella colwelliana]